MNLMNIVNQVKNAQKIAENVQKELSELDITGEAAGGAVRVICDGQGKFKSIKILPEAINSENPSSVDNESLEMLEDLISSAFSKAMEQASQEMNTRMKKITGGVNIPGLTF